MTTQPSTISARRPASTPRKGIQVHFPTVTESEAEDRFLALIADAGLPAPHTQVQMHGFRIDAYWPRARFAVEIDGSQWHKLTEPSSERDRRKQQVLQEHGIEVARTTWDQVTEEGMQLVARVASRLAVRTTEVVSHRELALAASD